MPLFPTRMRFYACVIFDAIIRNEKNVTHLIKTKAGSESFFDQTLWSGAEYLRCIK